jgi:hypothetical protein
MYINGQCFYDEKIRKTLFLLLYVFALPLLSLPFFFGHSLEHNWALLKSPTIDGQETRKPIIAWSDVVCSSIVQVSIKPIAGPCQTPLTFGWLIHEGRGLRCK